MPSRNIVKEYVKGGYYHIYNRGVEKRNIFQDEQDYKVMLNYLKEYLSPPKPPEKKIVSIPFKGGTFKGMPRQPKNYNGVIELICFNLMPNHYHFLVKQHQERTIQEFTQSVFTRYTMYFNKKYDRRGKLFESHYKAVLVNQDHHLLHLTRYIHMNSIDLYKSLEDGYSSYADYIGKRNLKWLATKEVLGFFENSTLAEINKILTYKDFVENYEAASDQILGNLTLE